MDLRRSTLAAGLCAAFVFPSFAAAQDVAEPDPAGWQAIISTQIEAMRNADGATALAAAAEGFRNSTPDPALFLMWIERSGYRPIIDSERHSFGTFEIDAEGYVFQSVTLVGADLEIYSATYQLFSEEDGWKVYGVVLREENAIAV